MAPKTTECCILKGNGGNRWQISPVWNAQNPWICLISQNKNTDSFLFSQKQQLFLNFWKKTENFVKIWWFCQKCKSIKIYFFCEKKYKRSLGIESVTKFWKFHRKSGKFVIFRDGQQARTNVNVFSFFSFFEKIFIHKGFFEYFFQKKQKIHEKVC